MSVKYSCSLAVLDFALTLLFIFAPSLVRSHPQTHPREHPDDTHPDPSQSATTTDTVTHDARSRVEVVFFFTIHDAGILEELHIALASLLSTINRPVRLNFAVLTDKDAEAVTKLFAGFKTHRVPVHYRFAMLPRLELERHLAKERIAVVHHAGLVGTAKFYLADLFPDLDAALLLDTDILVGSDLGKLWDLGEGMPGEAQVLMPIYGSKAAEANNVCSCVMYQRTKLMREAHFSTRLLLASPGYRSALAALHRKEDHIHPPFGDQSLYWWVLQHMPSLVTPMPLFWDMEGCHERFQHWIPAEPRPFGILHFNCAFVPEGARLLLDYWKAYQLAWLDGTGEHPVLEDPVQTLVLSLLA